MFERTALPSGPRVISARLPGARSVSIAAYVLAGSRLETPAEAGVAHFMEHITFKGTARFPSTRAISEAIEGVGGSFNAATDRESTVYWVRVPRREATRAMDVLGELIVRPRLADDEIEGERAVIVEEIRSYLDDPAEYAQILFQQAMFGDGPLGREICGDEEGIRALPAATIRDFWRTIYRPANTVVALAGDVGHDEAVALAGARRSGPATARSRATPRRRRCRPGKRFLFGARRDASQAQLVARRARPPPRPSRRVGPVGAQRRPRRRDVEPALPVGPRGARASPTTCRRVSSTTPMRARSRSRPASIRQRLPAALEAILAELVRLRDEPVPPEELDKAKAYLSGGLELRMDETRHLASWIGGQEALHDRVLTLEEALAAVAAVDAAELDPARRRALPRRGAPAGRRRPCPLRARPRAPPPPAGMTIAEQPVDQDSDERAADLVLARLHLRLGSLGLARAELETLAGRNALDDEGIRDLAEVRWRTGDLAGAGDAAAAYLASQPDDVLALVIAAEMQAHLGRPGEARRLAGRALAASAGPIDAALRRDAAQLDLARRHGRARSSRRERSSRTSSRRTPAWAIGAGREHGPRGAASRGG